MMSWANARILMTTDAVGGVWTYSTALAAALAARGYQILLVTLGPRPHADQLAAISRCPGVEVITTDRELEWVDPEGRDIADARKALLAQMQNLIYNEAPYDILYYDANLVAYRTDKFAGWVNMPSNGTPLFSYGTINYTLLTDATAPAPAPSASASGGGTGSPGASGGATTPTASAATTSGDTTGSSGPSVGVILLVLLLIVIVGGIALANRRRGRAAEDE